LKCDVITSGNLKVFSSLIDEQWNCISNMC